MHKLRSYIALLFLVLLLTPMAEKLWHEITDGHETVCYDDSLHYCSKQHSCQVCDYTFASSSRPPEPVTRLAICITRVITHAFAASPAPFTTPPFTFSLRGPPVY